MTNGFQLRWTALWYHEILVAFMMWIEAGLTTLSFEMALINSDSSAYVKCEISHWALFWGFILASLTGAFYPCIFSIKWHIGYKRKTYVMSRE